VLQYIYIYAVFQILWVSKMGIRDESCMLWAWVHLQCMCIRDGLLFIDY